MSQLVIPTWDNGTWTYTEFENTDKFKDFLVPLFKEPGKYEFNETAFVFNQESRNFNQNQLYCVHPRNSTDFIKYWDDQKEKCRKGVIYIDGPNTWYLTRDYYMWLNFLPIYDKEESKFGFAKIRDAQYHMALYEILAELHHKHVAIVKKRQIASSYFHAGKFINQIWFEEGAILKIGASLKDYINEKGTWKFLDEYKNFLNSHTAWYRPMNPSKTLMWQQKIEVTTGYDKRKIERGLKGVIQGMSFEKDPTTGVGGPCKYFFHEEAGIAPKMNTTKEYLMPAMKSGTIYTGMFIAAGSVGDLSQCEPLKDLILEPDNNDIYVVESDLIDDLGTIGRTGLFIPEQWSMPPFIDEYGNSKVEDALSFLNKQFTDWKKNLAPDKYQLRISQQPRNLKEAFDYREESKFPINLIEAQEKRIKDKEYPIQYMDIFRNLEGKAELKPSSKLPILEFPIKKAEENKEGIVVIYELPRNNPEFGEYYASVDPVLEGKTTTSDSLCSIYIYKNSKEVTRIQAETSETSIEHGKIVASWCGRFDDINRTHERLELLIELYNAWTVVENNVSLFIQYMISKKKQKYLVPKDQIMFLKDIGANKNVYQQYGWKNTGTLFKNHLLSYGIEFLKEELDTVTKEDGEIVKRIYGIERIPDIMLLKEMKAYRDGVNVDRMVAYCSLIAFVKIQESNRGYKKVTIYTDSQKLDNYNKFSKFTKNPFVHYGNASSNRGNKYSKQAFKNLR